VTDSTLRRAKGRVDVPAAEVRTFLIADLRGYTHFTAEQGLARRDVRSATLRAQCECVSG
jgi:class 3 adenylate cyclase